MAQTVYPSADGLRDAIEKLAELPTSRRAAHVPVLLGVESALAAGDSETVTIEGTSRQVVPNNAIKERLDRWFGVPGNEGWPYFAPMTLPGGEESRHWRTNGIIAQNTMSAVKTRRWVAPAVTVAAGRRGYPLLELDEWREAVGQDLGDDEDYARGIDLAALGVWLGRVEGIRCAGSTPTRDELIDAALFFLQLPKTHPLLTDDPEVLSTEGDYEPEDGHFATTPLSEGEILKIAMGTEEVPHEDGGTTSGTDEEGGNEWLRERFEEWKAESGYPAKYDQAQHAARQEFAEQLLAEEELAAGDLDLPQFRRFAVSTYGGPGSQSHMMRFLKENPETGPSELAATIHHPALRAW